MIFLMQLPFYDFVSKTLQISAKNHFLQKRTFSGWNVRFRQICTVRSFLTKWSSWWNSVFTIFSPKLLKSLPKTIFNKWSFWCNSVFTIFPPKLLTYLPKTIFHKNVRFQAETKVSQKFAVLDHFWPNDNLDVITFLRSFLQNCSNHCQKPFLTKRYVFRLKFPR